MCAFLLTQAIARNVPISLSTSGSEGCCSDHDIDQGSHDAGANIEAIATTVVDHTVVEGAAPEVVSPGSPVRAESPASEVVTSSTVVESTVAASACAEPAQLSPVLESTAQTAIGGQSSASSRPDAAQSQEACFEMSVHVISLFKNLFVLRSLIRHVIIV